MDNFMNKSALGIVAMTALLLGTPVLAADLAVKAPSPSAAPVFSWTGFYVGLDGGGAWARQNVSDVPARCVTPSLQAVL
jgi:outer membrane immunogenic protein